MLSNVNCCFLWHVVNRAKFTRAWWELSPDTCQSTLYVPAHTHLPKSDSLVTDDLFLHFGNVGKFTVLCKSALWTVVAHCLLLETVLSQPLTLLQSHHRNSNIPKTALFGRLGENFHAGKQFVFSFPHPYFKVIQELLQKLLSGRYRS